MWKTLWWLLTVDRHMHFLFVYIWIPLKSKRRTRFSSNALCSMFNECAIIIIIIIFFSVACSYVYFIWSDGIQGTDRSVHSAQPHFQCIQFWLLDDFLQSLNKQNQNYFQGINWLTKVDRICFNCTLVCGARANSTNWFIKTVFVFEIWNWRRENKHIWIEEKCTKKKDGKRHENELIF